MLVLDITVTKYWMSRPLCLLLYTRHYRQPLYILDILMDPTCNLDITLKIIQLHLDTSFQTIKVWDLESIHDRIHVIERHDLPLEDILPSGQGEVLTRTRNCVIVWDIHNGKVISLVEK